MVAVDDNVKAVGAGVLPERDASWMKDASEAGVAVEPPGALEVAKEVGGIGDPLGLVVVRRSGVGVVPDQFKARLKVDRPAFKGICCCRNLSLLDA